MKNQRVPIIHILIISCLVFILFSGCTKIEEKPMVIPESETIDAVSIENTSPSQSTDEKAKNIQYLIDPDHELFLQNEKEEYLSYEGYGSNFLVTTDVEFTIDINIDQINDNGLNSSTGINFWGYSTDGYVQIFNLTYQNGFWSAGYKLGWEATEFEMWETFDDLTSPSQYFLIKISENGKHITISNDSGFERILSLPDPSDSFFLRAETVIAHWQLGPFNTLKVTEFFIHILDQEIEDQTSFNSNQNDLQTELLQNSPTNEFHVSLTGDDQNPGTENLPFRTIEKARDTIRQINTGMDGDILVIIHGGIYTLSKPIEFSQIDSGQNGFQIIYRAAEGETPIFSGGVTIDGWKAIENTNLWGTKIEGIDDFRQLYVNGKRAIRAYKDTAIVGNEWVEGKFSNRDGIKIKSSLLPTISDPSSLELHWLYDWKDMRLPVDDIIDNKDGTKTIWMTQPYYSNALSMRDFDENHKWIPGFDIPFYVENAMELLDKPGEWYFDESTNMIYYYPNENEQIESSEFIIPQIQNLLNLSGKNVENEIHDVVFDGISFAYAGWTRASTVGTFGAQAQSLMSLNKWGDYETTPAHININHAKNIIFKNCQFFHMGALAIHMNNNVHDSTIEGNLFNDISDSAIMIGHWNHDYITSPLIQSPAQNNIIQNNLITDVGKEYWGAPAIAAYYVNNIRIVHNHIDNIPGIGISVGWGWSSTTDSTTCHNNYVSKNLITNITNKVTDGGGIYTLGQQPGTIIENNVIRNVNNLQPCLYTDEGSAYISLKENVCDNAGIWLSVWINTIHDNEIQNTYTNVKGIRNEGVNISISDTTYVDGQSWPDQAIEIIDDSGLEPPFEYLYDWID